MMKSCFVLRGVVAGFVLFVGLTVCVPLFGGGGVEDYRRAFGLEKRFGPANVLNDPWDIVWDSLDVFHFSAYTPAGRSYFIGDAGGGVECVDMDALVLLLGSETGKEVDRAGLVLKDFRVCGGDVCFEFDDCVWVVGDATGGELRLKDKRPKVKRSMPKVRHWMEVDDERGGEPVVSPDGKWVAFVKDDNICVCLSDGSGERMLTSDGTPGNYYSSFIKWSPDGRKIATTRIRPASYTRYVYYVESSPANQLQPILHKQEYPKPGDELRFKVPCIADVETGSVIVPSTDLFDNQYDIYGPEWLPDGRGVLFEYNERGHKVYRVLKLDAVSGEVVTVVEEAAETFVNYSRTYRKVLSDGRRMVWMSERDNWNHLYLVDIDKGGICGRITRGDWFVREVVDVDERNGRVLFAASGVNAEEDPYFVHYYSVGLDGKDLVCLTPEEGNHRAVFNGDFSLMVDKYSTVCTAPTTVLRGTVGDRDGDVVLLRADISGIVDAGWRAPEVFVAPGRDGVTPMWGIIMKPSDFDPDVKYPVLEYIYSGPGDAYTPKSFFAFHRYLSAIAELGFVVVQLDGMGTSYRGKDFEEVCYKNLKDAGFEDRKAWIRAAAKDRAYMDTSRVGIYGASAGGQEAMAAVLFHGDFYKAAYASCGCHDNRMDKIWWNEQWMSYPVDSSYSACSNVDNAHLLSRPLMLVVGELDDNVDPASTMQVVDALVKADKDFELVFLPGVSHTMGEKYGEHKRFDFFVRHLMGVEPPSWVDVAGGDY